MNAKLKKAVLAAAILSTPFAVSAANLVGGGASLPSVAYVGDGFTVLDPQARLSSSVLFAGINPGTGIPYNQVTVDGTSIFGVYNQGANNASYCQTGSSTGKRVLLSAADEIASGSCKDYSDSPDGFSGPNALPDFAGSDAPLTAGDISKFIDPTDGYQSQRTNLVQVPALGAFLGLPVNIQDGSGNAITNVDLDTAEVCSVFDGSAKVWSDVGVSSSQQIKVVYRSDGSGTTFAFTQYLAANCNIPATTFQTEELYSDAISLGVYGGREVGGSGNGGVIDAVTSTPGAIGYANFSNVAAEPGLAYALVEGHDPDNGGSINVDPSDILIDIVLGDPDAVTGLPTTQSLASAGGTEVGCLAVVNPAIQLTQSYPIVAFTNLLTYTNSNPNAVAVEDLFDAVSDATGLPAGYAAIDSAVIDNIISTCIN